MSTNSTPETHSASSPVELILNMALEYLASRALHVATALGIADQLAEGPRSIDELATSTGADREALCRRLRTLAGQGVFAEDEHGRFVLTLAAALQRNAPHPGKVMDILMMVFARGRERTEREFRALLEAAGFELTRITSTASTLSIVEAIPA